MRKLPKSLDRSRRLHIAAAWKVLGRTKKAIALLANLKEKTPTETAVLALIKGKPPAVKTLLKGRDDPAKCALKTLVKKALYLGNIPFALELVRAIPTTCPKVWALRLHALWSSEKLAELARVTDEALKADPKDPRVLKIIAEYRFQKGDYAGALALAEQLTRLKPTVSGRWGLLARVLSFGGQPEPAVRKRIFDAHEKAPKDIVLRFASGILHHYDQAHQASNTLLLPLLGAGLEETTALNVFIAMNDHGLGKSKAAAKRIDALIVKEAPHLQLYYMRAQVLRDIDRPAALADLKRHLRRISQSRFTRPARVERVKKLITELKTCQTKKAKICPSKWLRTGPRPGKPSPGVKPAPPTITQAPPDADPRPARAPAQVKDAAAATPDAKPMDTTPPHAPDAEPMPPRSDPDEVRHVPDSGSVTTDHEDANRKKDEPENHLLLEIIILGLVILLGFVIWRRGTQL